MFQAIKEAWEVGQSAFHAGSFFTMYEAAYSKLVLICASRFSATRSAERSTTNTVLRLRGLYQLPHSTHPGAPRWGQRVQPQGATQHGVQLEEIQHGILQPLARRRWILSHLGALAQMPPVLLRCQNATYPRLVKLQLPNPSLEVAPRARELPIPQKICA